MASVFFRFLFCLILLLGQGGCASRLVPKETQAVWNEELSQKTYILKEDIRFQTGEILLKGTAVRIYFESTPSLLKIKCYLPHETRESARGKLAHYVINDSIPKKKLDRDDLDEIINQKFVLQETPPPANNSKKNQKKP